MPRLQHNIPISGNAPDRIMSGARAAWTQKHPARVTFVVAGTHCEQLTARQQTPGLYADAHMGKEKATASRKVTIRSLHRDIPGDSSRGPVM